MSTDVITTGVDELLDLLKRVDKIPITEAAQKLGINVSVLQTWVDFLVEEEIVGIEYKFTKPIIYLNKPPEETKANVKEEVETDIDTFKDDFNARAKQRSIPADKIPFFWRNHVKESLNRKKDFFYREARKRNLSNIDGLWDDYSKKLLES